MLYELQITTRAPLHIGSGQPALRARADFIAGNRFVYVLDQDRVLDSIVPADGDPAIIEQITRSYDLSGFVTESDLRANPELYRYRLGGSARVSEIRPQIKDAHARPYLPGSTLRGAIRTALGTALARDARLNPAQWDNKRERAARSLEEQIFSTAQRPAQAPNHDLLRAIQVGDSAPVARESLELLNVVVWPAGQRGIPIDVEGVRADTTFTARLKLDNYLLESAAPQLRWQPAQVETMRAWVSHCRAHGLARIQHEADFFTQRSAGRAPAVERFYADLLREAEVAAPDTFYAQIGWGAGWHSKTLSRVIVPDRALFAEIVRRYRLGRGRYDAGAPFPKTRHVVADRGQPVTPLGWVRVQVHSLR